MKNKRGISAIVATVLIILITVAAVTLIWAAIIPMINEDLETIDIDTQFNVVSSGGYTAHDPSNDMISVQIKRGPDERTINEVDIIVMYNDGNTITYRKPAPGPNEMITHEFKGETGKTPISVKVVPIIIKGNEEETGMASGDVDFKEGSISDENVPANPCGDGTCDAPDGEDCNTCEADCGACVTPDADGPLDVTLSQDTAINTNPTGTGWYGAAGGVNTVILKLFNDYGENIYLKSFNLNWTNSNSLTNIQTSRHNNSDQWTKHNIWNAVPLSSPATADFDQSIPNRLRIYKDDHYVIDGIHFNGAVSPTEFNLTLFFTDFDGTDIGSSTLRFTIP